MKKTLARIANMSEFLKKCIFTLLRFLNALIGRLFTCANLLLHKELSKKHAKFDEKMPFFNCIVNRFFFKSFYSNKLYFSSFYINCGEKYTIKKGSKF